MTETTETLTPEQRAERFSAKCGCWACGERGHILNLKSLYCANCQAISDEVLAQREARRARPPPYPTPRASVSAPARQQRVGVGASYGDMADFMNEVDWQDAMHPNEGCR